MQVKNVVYRDPQAMVAIRIEGDFNDLDLERIEEIVKRRHIWADVEVRGPKRIGAGYLDIVNGSWETHQSVPPGFVGWLVVSDEYFLFFSDAEFEDEFMDQS